MRVRWTSLFAASLLLSAFSGACSQQGEGMVCDPRAGNGGNDDCQDGYVCTEPSQLAAGTQGYRCCPSDPALASGVCALGTSTIPEDSAAPSEDATFDAEPAAPDAYVDAGLADADAAGGEGGDP